MNKIQYISPSAFYYWEKCPFQAILSKKTKSLFPNNPDSDLGSLIHKFYEKQIEWKINTVEKFNAKWNEEVEKINEQYKKDELQINYYPIQWYSKYYAVKKNLLSRKLLSMSKKGKKKSKSSFEYLYEDKISNDIISGKIDLLIKENDNVMQLIDYKTGSIYENVDYKTQLKESFKQQLALYCSVILEKQDFIPDLIIETIDGKRKKIKVDKEYINELTYRARLLKEKINLAIEKNTTSLLANPTIENCRRCNLRTNCDSYKSKLINNRIGLNIDIKGEIITVTKNEVAVQTNNGQFIVKKIKQIDKYREYNECEIYNLYFPESDEKYLYETKNTVIKYER